MYAIKAASLCFVILILLCSTAAFCSGRNENPLIEVRNALANLHYDYKKPGIIEESYVRDHDFFPYRVTKYIYPRKDNKTGKIEYYTFYAPKKLIGTDIYLYADATGPLKSVVFINNKNELQEIERIIPFESVLQDYRNEIEVFEERDIRYDKNGMVTRDSRITYTAYHKEKKATLSHVIRSGKNEVLSRKQFEWDYYDLCPMSKMHPCK